MFFLRVRNLREMRANANSLIPLRFLYPTILSSFPQTLTLPFSSSSSSPTKTLLQPEQQQQDSPLDTTDIFRRCGCTDADISKLLLRQPSLLKANLKIVQSKLRILQSIGLEGSHLVKIITCRPRILASRLPQGLDHRLEFLQTLFGSRQMLLKAITRNPSLLNYGIEERIKPCIKLYQEIGVSGVDLRGLLISRPTIVLRSSLNKEKLEYIARTGLSNESKMYKYVVSLIAVSRLETIREKVSNFENFGFSVDEVMSLFSRSPNVLTLSVDKVQRNMTYVIGTMKLPARVVLDHPFFLYLNLETMLRPRFLLAMKIRAMGLQPQIMGPSLLRAMRMKEPRFLRAFINCHKVGVAKGLMEFYTEAKEVKRLAQDSKVAVRKGFPF
ncbi:transcription termination factor MTERF15, mitochondrial-like [Tasmannia lanceolata]|uniref:transcription termination factor MTERF15, mitochondrial-like n=1 Tax=Tasmannia lanceolata TaxID=3420 RepID=UPI00406381E5